MIKSDASGQKWELRTMQGKAVEPGYKCDDPHGDDQVLQLHDATPPHKPSSTGRIYTKGGSEFYPSVMDLIWVKVDEPKAVLHVTPAINEQCDHDWPDQPQDSSCCAKCGLSFLRYIHSCIP